MKRPTLYLWLSSCASSCKQEEQHVQQASTRVLLPKSGWRKEWLASCLSGLAPASQSYGKGVGQQRISDTRLSEQLAAVGQLRLLSSLLVACCTDMCSPEGSFPLTLPKFVACQPMYMLGKHGRVSQSLSADRTPCSCRVVNSCTTVCGRCTHVFPAQQDAALCARDVTDHMHACCHQTLLLGTWHDVNDLTKQPGRSVLAVELLQCTNQAQASMQQQQRRANSGSRDIMRSYRTTIDSKSC